MRWQADHRGRPGDRSRRRREPPARPESLVEAVADRLKFQVLVQLAASPATAAVPVVVLSGDSGQEMVEDLLAAGASGFLAKPFAVGELLAIVARHLG